MSPIPQLDAVIIGGGIAGLWLANLLQSRGDQIALLEARQLGSGQTLASQGMIHGGIKYALGGSLTSAAQAIAGMPDRWRRCLNGDGEIDLSGLTALSKDNLLFADGTSLGRFRTFFASRALRGRLQRLEPEHWPEALNGCTGWVYTLNDLVIDTPTLIDQLARPLTGSLYQHPFEPDQATRVDGG
jgi:glycerol-3-phosphate dehydrogenase